MTLAKPPKVAVRGLACFALGLALVGCGSTTAAAPVTSKVTTVETVNQTITVNQTSVETTTETTVLPSVVWLTVTETPLPPTKTVTKAAPAPVTKVITETSTVAADPVTVTADPVTVAPAPAAGASGAGSFGDGTQLVGTDVQAGTYRAPGGAECYWERLKGASGSVNDIIANDMGTTNPVVQIAASDYAFTSSNCGGWTKIG